MSPGSIATGNLKQRLRVHVFEIATALAWLLVGTNYLLDINATIRSPIGATMHPFDYGWSTMYVIGAPLVIAGIAWSSQRVRVAGLTLLGTALFMHFIAAVTQTPLEARDFIYLCYSLACLIRAFLAAEDVHPTKVGRRVTGG